MAENFSAFDYKTQEEVFIVIKHFTSILSTSGMQLVEILSPSHLLGQLHGQLPEHAQANVSEILMSYLLISDLKSRVVLWLLVHLKVSGQWQVVSSAN